MPNILSMNTVLLLPDRSPNPALMAAALKTEMRTRNNDRLQLNGTKGSSRAAGIPNANVAMVTHVRRNVRRGVPLSMFEDGTEGLSYLAG